MVGRVERLEFSSQSSIDKLKANTEKTKRAWVYKSRQIFHSRSPVESCHINERGLFTVQTVSSGKQYSNENVNNSQG